MLHFASVCTPCWMMLDVIRVVAQSLKPVKLLSQKLPTCLLFRDRRSVAQQCWIRSHSSSNIVGATHAHYPWFTKTYGLYPSHDALQVPTLLGVVACVCRPLPARKQQLPTLLVQQCWESTMLGVVASVCTQSKSSASSFESWRRRHMWDVGYRSWSCAEWFFSWYSGTTFVVKIHSNFSSIRQCRQRAILLMCYQDIDI